MECEAARAQLADRLTGALTPEASAALDVHLNACDDCAAAARADGDTWAMLGEIPAADADSAAMRARFDQAVAAAAVDGFAGVPLPAAHPRHGFNWMAPGLQVAAAIVLVAAGFLVGRQSSPPRAADPALAELREELRATRQMVSLSLLQQQSASERLRGVTYTTQIDRPDSEVVTALIETLLHDPDANVRLKTIDVLKRFADRANVRQAAIDALTEPASSALVQIALIDFLVEANDRDSASSLRRLIGDDMVNKAVRDKAAWGLQHIG